MTIWPTKSESSQTLIADPDIPDALFAVIMEYSHVLGHDVTAQLALSAHHLHRVLQTVNSSPEMIFSCTLYLSCASSSTRILDLNVLEKALVKILRTLSSIDKDDCSLADESSDPAKFSLPLLIAYVSDLPRRAALELEVVAATLILPIANRKEFYCTSNDDSEEFQMLKRRLAGHSPLDEYLPVLQYDFTKELSNRESLTCRLNSVFYEGDIVAGSCKLHTLSPALDDLIIDYNRAIAHLLLCLRAAMIEARIHPRDLLSVRVYYLSDTIERSALSQIVGAVSAVVFDGVSIHMQIIPLPVMAELEIISCSFCAVCLEQLNTDIWVLGMS